MRRFADRHLAAAAKLVEGDAKRVGHLLFIEMHQASGRRGAGDEAEELGGEPTLRHCPVWQRYSGADAGRNIGSRGDRGYELLARHAAELFSRREGHRYGGDAHVRAATYVIVIEHVTEAAVDECSPGRRRFAAEAED